MAQPTLEIAPNRHIGLDSLAEILKDQRARAVDVIAAAASLQSVEGNLVIAGTVPQLSDDGVTMTAGTYAVNDIALGGIGEKLGALHRRW